MMLLSALRGGRAHRAGTHVGPVPVEAQAYPRPQAISGQGPCQQRGAVLRTLTIGRSSSTGQAPK